MAQQEEQLNMQVYAVNTQMLLDSLERQRTKLVEKEIWYQEKLSYTEVADRFYGVEARSQLKLQPWARAEAEAPTLTLATAVSGRSWY